MTKSITLLIVITALVSGIFTFTMADASKGDDNGQPFQELQTHIDELNTKVDNVKPDHRIDSFFDVFFDVFTVDSFFDVFTELQADVDDLKGNTEDINIGIGELQEKDQDLQSQIDDLETPDDLPVFIKHVTLRDNEDGHAMGWDPYAFSSRFDITEPDLRQDSILTMYVEFPRLTNGITLTYPIDQICSDVDLRSEIGEQPIIHLSGCSHPDKPRIPEFTVLHYTLVNPTSPDVDREQIICDPSLDGMIDAKDLAHHISIERDGLYDVSYTQDLIDQIESGSNVTPNGVIDTEEELDALNVLLDNGAIRNCPAL